MATNENLISIPGRLHSVAIEGHVSGADEIYDDTQQKNQETINSELIQAVGTGGSVDSRISAAINALDASVSKPAGADGLALSVTEENGKVTAINGSIASNTYDVYGSASAAQLAAISAAATDATTKVNAAKAEIKGNATSACDTLGEAEALILAETSARQSAINNVIGDATTDYNTLGKLEGKIQAEASRAQRAESTLQTSIDTEVTRAQAAEADRYTKSETYTKTEVNGLVDTPHQEYVTVDAYASLPATGSKDTIYRVSNYNGSTSQVDASVYSEYAWNGTQYIFLCVKSQIGEVFDISVYNNNATYQDLVSALGTNGANVPETLRKGGMSVKFVQSSDNKYVQYRLLAQNFTTDTTQWAVTDEGVYVENTEFVYVKTDAEGKILWAIKADGGIYYGAGVPQQVIDYIEEKIADLSLDEFEDIVAFLNDLEKGDKTLQTLLNEKVDKEEGKSLIPIQYIQETENSAFVEACTDNEDKLIEATTKEGAKVFFGDVDVKHDLTAKKISSNKICLGENELSPVSTVAVNTIINDPEGRLEIKTDGKQKIISYRDEKGILHENVGIETKELKLSQAGLDLLSKDLKVNWSDYISSDGENPLHLSMPKCARINLLTDFDLTKLSKAGYSMYSKEGVNYDIPIELEFWDMQGNYFKKKAFIGGQGDSTMAFDKKNIAIDLFDSEWDGDTFSIKFGDWVAQDSFHLKAYDYEPFVGAGAWSYKLFEQMMSVYSPEVDHIWKRALWDTTANTPTQASGSDLSESSEYNDTGARCFPDGFPVVVYQLNKFWGVFSMQMKKHRDNYHMSSSKPNHVFLDGKIGEGTLDANGDPDAIRWDLWEVRNPKNLVYAPFALYNPGIIYKEGASVTDFSRSRIYRSLQDNNTGNPLEFPYWKDCGEYTYKYDADVTQAEIAGNHDGSSSYNNWTAGTYNVGDLRKHTIDGKSHIFMNVVAGNDKEPAIVYNAQKDEWYNTDKSPDFKNKSKCGWLNITNTVKVKEKIFAFTTIMTKIDAKETAYLANPTAENLAAMKAEFETYFDVQNLIDYIVITDVIRDDDAFWKNWLWTTYDGIKWWCNLYDCNISFGYGGAGTGGFYRSPAPYKWDGYQYHLCTYKHLQPDGKSEFMLRYIIDYYADELKQTWIELRDGKIIDENNIYNIAKKWIDAVGLDAYALENAKWGYVKHIDNMVRIKKWIYQSVLGLDPLYGYFDDLYADFTIYRGTERDYTIRCIDMKVSHKLSRELHYIQGYITRHESTVGGETVSTYSITGGEETEKDMTKNYVRVKEAITEASSQPVDVPSENLFYIVARCENIEYHRR